MNKENIFEIIKDILIFMMFFSNSVLEKNYSVITNKGIFLNKFYKWEKIKGYKWIDENKIEFHINGKIKPNNPKKIEVFGIHREEVDKIFIKFIDYNEFIGD